MSESHLADLKSRRAALAERLAALHDTRDRLRAAEQDETDALQAIGAIDAAERLAMAAWAEAGGHGNGPALDHDARTTATRRLAIAQAKAAAARGAGRDVEAQIVATTAEGADVAAQIERAALADLVEQFDTERAGLATLATEVRERVGRTFGCAQLIREHADAHRDAGRAGEARALYAMLEQLGAVPPLDFVPSVGEVAAGLPAWASRYGELVR